MNTKPPLPKPHEKVLGFIKDFLSVNKGVSPSYSEIQTGLGLSRGSVQNSLGWLETHRYIGKMAGKARSIILLDIEPTVPARGIPLLGEIAAGYLSEPLQTQETIDFNLDPDQHFALRVSGDSMRDAGILNGMKALFKRVPDGYEPSPGKIVAAWVEGSGTTLKRFYRNEQTVILEAANPDYQPQPIDTSKILLRIEGIWVGTIAEIF
jgi:repressor LexA